MSEHKNDSRFLVRNAAWIISSLFAIAIFIGGWQAIIDAKADKADVFRIVNLQIDAKAFPMVDGKVMEAKLDNIADDLAEIKGMIKDLRR